MKIQLKYIPFLLCIALSIELSAQLNYKSGYLITAKNDSLVGLINDGGTIKNSRVCLFKADRKSKAVRYSPKDLKFYRFDKDKCYASHTIFHNNEYKKVFTEVLVKGNVNLLYYWGNKETSFFIQRGNGPMIGLLDREGIISPATTKLIDPKKALLFYDIYKDTLFTFFRDSKETLDKVDFLEYRMKPLIKITQEYNNLTCSGQHCVDYVKDLTVSRESFGIYTGIGFSKVYYFGTMDNNMAKSNIVPSIPFGIFYNVPMPAVNSRLSFQIELITTGVTYRSGTIQFIETDSSFESKSRTIGIPLLFKYSLPTKSKVTSSVGLGKETCFVVYSNVLYNGQKNNILHMTQRGGWFCEYGVDYKVQAKYSVFANLRIQSYSNLVLESNNGNRSTYNKAMKDPTVPQFKTILAALQVGIRF
jgi:hypothetical protein